MSLIARSEAELHSFPRLRRLLANPGFQRASEFGARERSALDGETAALARNEISSWPGYDVTPLHDLRGLARSFGLGAIWHKDEGRRFGLGSFKALGGAYGVFRVLATEIERRGGDASVSSGALVAGRHEAIVSRTTVATASAGNHGRAVAWGSEMFGCRCVIFLPETANTARAEAITRHGARVVRAGRNYDEAVRLVREEAETSGWIVVSDTADPGYTEIPRRVMEGYTVLMEEALEQSPDARPPSHVFVQAGVGGLAAALCGYLWQRCGVDRPVFVTVEPAGAACCMASAERQARTTLGGPAATGLTCLACREPSSLAWEILDRGSEFFLTIPDEAAYEAMRILANAPYGDPPVVCGDAGAAGLAGLLSAAGDPHSREILGLSRESLVLVIGTEGAIDPDQYCAVVGRTAQEVQTGQDEFYGAGRTGG